MPPKPRCFVALAVGPDDTAAYYDRLVKPVLERNAITPVVISLRESNDDLNKQIIEQLEKCDLCIADLTYARPSVYFEAGYAQRSIPVIYTVRKDHLGRNQPDHERVHFDLAMKPLIRWSKPSDAGFRKRLEKRIRATFLKEWKGRRESDARLERARRAFSGLPLKERLARLRRHAIVTLRARGFRSWAAVRPSYESPFVGRIIRELSYSSYTLSSSRYERGTFVMVFVHAFHSPSKTELAQLAGTRDFGYQIGRSDIAPKRGAVHTFVFALKPVPPSRLDAALPNYYPGQPSGHYSRRDFIRLAGPGETVPFIAMLDCLSDIKSESEFRSSFEERVSHVGEV